ncbi:MAG: sigma 54-interacting transcriptional regulator [Enhygromyxa sp.]
MRLIGRTPAIVELRERICQVAGSDLSVLLVGETGVGKGLVAREIHRAAVESEERSGPLVIIDCPTIPPAWADVALFGQVAGAFSGTEPAHQGPFELAEGGTVFLDGIHALPDGIQAKLLRVLDEREVLPVGARQAIPVNVRIVAAAQGHPSALRAGELRADLYHRVCESLIEIPPLRTRRPDIRLLAEHFLSELGTSQRLSSAAYQTLARYAWPGNVRELRSVVRRAALLHPEVALLEPELLFEAPLPDSQGDGDLGRLLDCHWEQAKEEFARWYWTNVWQAYAGDRPKIAEHTRVSDVWLRSRRKLYGLQSGGSK